MVSHAQTLLANRWAADVTAQTLQFVWLIGIGAYTCM